MLPKILTWNVRGLNDINKRLRIRSLLRPWKADIICLQEIKLKLITRTIRSMWGCQYVGWAYKPSDGASGGILVMWDKRVVENVDEFVGEYSVGYLFKNSEDDFVWAFTGVYGPNSECERRLLWDELADLRGDFNVTRFPSERSGGGRQNHAMGEFSNFISELELMDIPLMGGDYTWSNNYTCSKLDRFLISSSWEMQFPDSCQKRLFRLCTDHFPIILDCGGIPGGRRHFKFENMWLKSKGFVELVRQW
ncbi:hypothetical protein I3760_05G090600 [Carya illinoinensis]|nr:hypothetical protein I3760_05G090600 [Carya illinoinensis]